MPRMREAMLSMRTVVGETLRDRFAVVLLAAASVPLVLALGFILASAVGGSSPPPAPAGHLSVVPPQTSTPAPQPTFGDLPFSTPTPSVSASAPPTPASTPADPFADLCSQTQAAVHDSGLATDLCHRLSQAEQGYTASDPHTEGEAVRGYIRQLRGAPAKVVNRDAANGLIATAQTLPGLQSQSPG